MPETADPIEDQLRAWADDLAAQVSRFDAAAPLPNPRRRWRRQALLAAAVLLLAAGVAVLLIRGDGPDRVITRPDPTAPPRQVVYERMAYELTVPPGCEEVRAGHRRAVVEAWSDPTGRRWRNRFTFPDGSTHDIVLEGSPWRPVDRYEQRSGRLAAVTCAGEPAGGMLAYDGLVTLDPEPVSPGDGLRDVSLWWALLRDREGATRLPDARDGRGRLSAVWRSTRSGSGSEIRLPDDGGPDRTFTYVTTTDVYVDLGSGRINAVVDTETVDDRPAGGYVLTAIERGTRSVPADWFATAGYRHTGHSGPGGLEPATTTTAPR